MWKKKLTFHQHTAKFLLYRILHNSFIHSYLQDWTTAEAARQRLFHDIIKTFRIRPIQQPVSVSHHIAALPLLWCMFQWLSDSEYHCGEENNASQHQIPNIWVPKLKASLHITHAGLKGGTTGLCGTTCWHRAALCHMCHPMPKCQESGEDRELESQGWLECWSGEKCDMWFTMTGEQMTLPPGWLWCLGDILCFLRILW